MISIEPITSRNVLVFRDVRLRALQDAPTAFGSNYAQECQLTHADWRERVLRWNGQGGAGFLAMDQNTACGIAGVFIDERDPTRAQMVSMWIAPTQRRRGIGRLLVEDIVTWVRQREGRTLGLMVTSNNESAISFYRRLGFTPTGRTEPYPNDPSLIEV
jgi:ribosomal protein S18 acetylase RimI-like enzyme